MVDDDVDERVWNEFHYGGYMYQVAKCIFARIFELL